MEKLKEVIKLLLELLQQCSKKSKELTSDMIKIIKELMQYFLSKLKKRQKGNQPHSYEKQRKENNREKEVVQQESVEKKAQKPNTQLHKSGYDHQIAREIVKELERNLESAKQQEQKEELNPHVQQENSIYHMQNQTNNQDVNSTFIRHTEKNNRKKEEVNQQTIEQPSKEKETGYSKQILEKAEEPPVKKIGLGIPITIEKRKESSILFDDIDNNSEIFARILLGIDNMKKNLLLPEEDQVIYLKLIGNLEKDFVKLKDKIDKKIGKEDIDEDDYSEVVTNEFIKVLKDGYRRLIDNITAKINYSSDQKYVETYHLFEQFVFDLGMTKGLYKEEMNIDNIIDYFDVVPVTTTNKDENKKIKSIDFQPYFISYQNDDGDKEEMYIYGRLVFYQYKGE